MKITAIRSALTKPALCLTLMLILSGCDTIKDKFVDANNIPLPGERISVLQLQKDLAPDPMLAGQPPMLPESWQNKFWPQAGGYPTHSMGHLAVADNLKEAWDVSIGSGGSTRSPLISLPIVAEDTVFALDTKGNVSAFALSNGKRKWKQSVVPRGEQDSSAVGGGIAYASGKIFVTSGYKNLTALNPQSGAIVWKAEIPAPARAAPTAIEDRVFVTTLDNRLIVLSATDGTKIWDYEGVSETTNLLGSAGPAVDTGIVVLPLSSGQIFGLDPENGRIIWEDNLSAVRRAGALSSISDIRALPIIDQGNVFAVSFSGRMVVLDQKTGRRAWQRELGSAETPWIAGDTLFVVTASQQLTALSRLTGGVRWIVDLPRYKDRAKEQAIFWSGPVLAGNRLFVTGSNSEMMILSPEDGRIIATQKLSDPAVGAPIVADGTLLVLTQNGKLTAWR